MAVPQDPLGVAVKQVEVSKLKRWTQTQVPHYEQFVGVSKQSPFVYNPKINEKIVLWVGDVTLLRVDAIINPTNEGLTIMTATNEKIYNTAGPGLIKEMREEIKRCATGDSKLSNGFNLPSRHIIHTVGPKYNVKYLTAVENALYRCYRSVLLVAREHNFQSIAIPTIHLYHRGFPIHEGAHIALRTIRRFLEDPASSIETVTLVLDNAEMEVYSQITALYFPRNVEEEAHAAGNLPADIGNELGEPMIKDRLIRIQDKIVDPEYEDSDRSVLDSNTSAFRAFSQMVGDHDQARVQKLQVKKRQTSHWTQCAKRYQSWLKLARSFDTKEIMKLNALYRSGLDQIGRSVIVFIGHNFPANAVDLNKAISCYIYLMDGLVDQDYVAVYFHTLTSVDERPPASFLKLVYEALDPKYRKNLKTLFVVHPTWRLRLSFWSFYTFTAPELKNKIEYVSSLAYLFKFIHHDQLNIPQYIFDQDRRINGINNNSSYQPKVARQDEL